MSNPGDLISREAAIAAIKNEECVGKTATGEAYNEGLNDAVWVVEKLLAALPATPVPALDSEKKCFRCHQPFQSHPAICAKCLSTPAEGVF